MGTHMGDDDDGDGYDEGDGVGGELRWIRHSNEYASSAKSELEFAAINTTADWCIACANSQDRGCATCDNQALAQAAAAELAGHHHTLSPAAAGVVGAAVTAVVFLLALMALGWLGLVSFGRKSRGTVHSRVS